MKWCTSIIVLALSSGCVPPKPKKTDPKVARKSSVGAKKKTASTEKSESKVEIGESSVNADSIGAKAGCSTYTYAKITGEGLDKDLEEMSGLVRSGEEDNLLIHVRDSGNEPLLVTTDRNGSVLKRYKFADYVTDTEDLARGKCPWGGSCLYVFDTGDNAHSRKKRSIIAIDESTLESTKIKSQKVEYTYPDGELLDVEAAVLSGDTFYLFEKEKDRSRVYSISFDIWNTGESKANLVTELEYSKLTGAAASADGKRILLLGYTTAYELSKEDNNGSRTEDSWFPYRLEIKVKRLAQQEAIAYDKDDRSFLYSSEKGSSPSSEWGVMKATCKP